MIELRLFLDCDTSESGRLRELLDREGFRVLPPGADAAERGASVIQAVGEELPLRSEEMQRRIEELEMELRELRNLDVAKSQFLANVSHELRTPLTAIVTYGEVLRDGLLGDVTPRQEEAIQAVIGSSRQLLGMIEEILTYARTNALATQVETSRFEVEEVVRDVHRMSASLIRKKHIHFEMVLEPGLPRAAADRDKVLHVLGNLVGNAIDFTPEGGTIEVSARRNSRERGWIEVAVSDTGIGIDPEYHEMIFQEFAQVDSSRSRRHHGTGLGLAIARSFVRLHGGEIWVESELGRGSQFRFTIPSEEAGKRSGAA